MTADTRLGKFVEGARYAAPVVAKNVRRAGLTLGLMAMMATASACEQAVASGPNGSSTGGNGGYMHISDKCTVLPSPDTTNTTFRCINYLPISTDTGKGGMNLVVAKQAGPEEVDVTIEIGAHAVPNPSSGIASYEGEVPSGTVAITKQGTTPAQAGNCTLSIETAEVNDTLTVTGINESCTVETQYGKQP